MIISTSQSDTMLKRALGKNQVSIISIDKMLDQFSIDPTLTTPVRDAYIVTDSDIRAAKTKQKFEQCLATKHPNTKIIFICKGKNNPYPEGIMGVSKILMSPKPNEITDAISQVIEGNQVDGIIRDSAHAEINVPDFDPNAAQFEYQMSLRPEAVQQETLAHAMTYDDPNAMQQAQYDPNAMQQPYDMMGQQPVQYDEPEVLDVPEPEPYVKPVEEQILSSQIIDDIKNTNRMADINVLMREISSSTLIKDLINTHSTYAAVEEKIKAIQESIFLIMKDPNIRTLEEKLNKIRALAHDRDAFASKGDSIIELRLEEIIDTLCTQTSSLLESRLGEIDTAIRRAQSQKEMGIDNARLAGLNEESVNIILELHKLEKDILDIFKSCNGLIIDTVSTMAENNANITGNELLNSRLRASNGVLVTDETLAAIRAAMELSTEKVSVEMQEMRLKVISMIKLLNKLFDLDREQIAAYQATVDYMKANNIEDTIVAQTLLKKSLRVFIGNEKTGRTIIPYLLSSYKSRQNANVLLLDITGSGKYHEYGIQVKSVESYLTELNQVSFMIAAGEVDDSVAIAQRIVNALIKAADYYRVINVVMRPDQKELFDTISQDVLCVNYITDTTPSNIRDTKQLIDNTRVRNVGRRVIINKCDVAIRPIISKLGLDDELDFQACTIPTIPAITDANLNGYDPVGISSVTLAMEETLKHA